MAKYEPLRRYLARQKTSHVELTFTEIERLIGAMLPKRAQRPQWWSTADAHAVPGVQTAAWRSAGFVASLNGEEKVRFDRG